MAELIIQKKAKSTGLGSLIRHGSESLNNAMLVIAVAGISLISSLYAQSNPTNPQDFGILQFGHKTSIGFQIPLHYDAMPKSGSYVLSRTTDEHCYVAGINFDSGKPNLFIRVFDPYPKDGKNIRFTCGYVPYIPSTESMATEPWGTDQSVKASKEISIAQGESVIASLKIVDGFVKMHVIKGNDTPLELSLDVKDNATTFDMLPFNFPPGRLRTYKLREKPVVTEETAIWTFR